jgi:hypothetical protein
MKALTSTRLYNTQDVTALLKYAGGVEVGSISVTVFGRSVITVVCILLQEMHQVNVELLTSVQKPVFNYFLLLFFFEIPTI